MAVAFRSSSNTGTSDSLTTSCAVPVPSGAAANDIALVGIEHYDGASLTITPPAGFTLLFAVTTSLVTLRVWWKRLSGGDTGSYTFTWSGSKWNLGHAVLLTGAKTSGDPIGTNYNTVTGTGTSIPSTSVTVVFQPGLVHFVANESAATQTTVPTGFTEVQDGDYLHTNYRIPGTTGTHSASGGSLTTSTPIVAALIAVEPEAAGSTAVGKDLGLRWSTRQAVGDTMQAVWHTRQALGDPVSLAWNTRLAVGDPVVARWNTRAPAGRQLQAVWDVRAPVGDALQAMWDARALAGDATDLQWATRQTLGEDLQLVWNVASALSAVGKDVALAWDTRASTGDALQVAWNTRAPVAAAVQLVWHVRQAVADILGLAWSARQAVGDEVALAWAVRATVGDGLQLVWDVQSELVITTPAERTMVVDAELRVVEIDEARSLLIPAEARAYTVERS